MLPLVLASTLALSSTCAADDTDTAPPPDTAAQVQQQVSDVYAQMAEQTERLAAIERFLADQARQKAGAAPKDWVQPPLADYLKPGAPESLIPGAVAVVIRP